MIAFFVRVSSHLRIYEGDLDGDQKVEIIDTFFWDYWKRMGLVNAVESVHSSDGGELAAPYFIVRIKKLESYYMNAPAQQDGAD